MGVLVYALQDGSKPSLQYPLQGEGMVNSVAFSADSKLIASGYDDSTVLVTDMSTRQNFTLDESFDAITQVAFCDSRLASGSWDGSVRVYGLEAGAKPTLLYQLQEATDWVSSVAISADAEFLAAGSYDYKLRLYRLDPVSALISI